MEHNDRAIILEILKTNQQLKRLYDEHVTLESKLSRLRSRNFLTAQEEMEIRRLKKIKLKGVDRMMSMISEERVM